MSKNDIKFMKRALSLAKKGGAFVSPNPTVGAVVVKNGKIISEGWHKKFGGPHAEVEALRDIDVEGATLYVTLEPCCHHGKTPPCTDLIIAKGIKKVVISSTDPFKKVSGKGIKILKKAGLEVESGILGKEAEELNEAFFTFHKKKRPFISLKSALSKDGMIAKNRNERTFLTSKEANEYSQILRSKHQAILVGSGTVLADNPHLGLRGVEGNDPLRIILTKKDLPKNLQIFRDENYLIWNGTIKALMKELYKRNIISVLVEGGQEIYKSFIKAKLVDKVYIYKTPHILGKDSIAFPKISLKTQSVQKLGQDTLVVATPEWDSKHS